VRRGYIGCVYAGADAKDDTEEYSEIWADEHDFSRLMRRAFGAYRAIDYLYTLPFIDKDKIALTGHSRNGKLSLMAAAFDERIKAVIPSSGGTGAEVPWRYCAQKYDVEDLALLTCAQPAWFHPRLRYFVGRENKLPVDQNLFMALIAPRGLMLSTAINEGASNPWGIEQAYYSALKVYEFLEAGDNLAIRNRQGLHSVCARDMEDYIDFFDYVFKRSNHKPENKLFYNYSFEKWRQISGEVTDPMDYPAKDLDDLIEDKDGNTISSVSGWEKKKEDIQKRLQWILGDEPPGVINPGPQVFNPNARDENSFGTFLVRPAPTERMGRMPVSPYSGFGDNLFGYLYYPADEEGNLKKESMPVMIYLHEYDYSKGFNSYHRVTSFIEALVDSGYAVFSYDMMGFGNRIEEGTRFYDRYPNWSKMGKLVVDVQGALDALTNFNFVDTTKIFVAGYALGATVGLYTAALDERIAGVVSVCGFTPMRLDTPDRGTEGIKAYSHLHGLLPRLGFFIGYENRIPYDFHEILACIAPRQVLVIAPEMDKDAHLQDIKYCVDRVKNIYQLYGASNNIQIYTPNDYNRFYEKMRMKTYAWAAERLNE
jgi:dienelactone hydrolase